MSGPRRDPSDELEQVVGRAVIRADWLRSAGLVRLVKDGFVIDRAADVAGASSLAFGVGRLSLQLPWRE